MNVRPAASAPVLSPREDELFMAEALKVGQTGLGRTWPNPSVGAVVVQHVEGVPRIVSSAATAPTGRPHAEPLALAAAGELARGSTLYVTLEPCSHHGRTPPCADAVIAAGVSRVVAAIEDPDHRVKGRGVARLRAAGIWVTVGVGAEQALFDHAGHIRRVTEGRPHVMVKMAVSADGKAAHAGPKPAVVTGPEARARAHLMRAHTDAILVGLGTVLADDPMLTCRLEGYESRSPVRLVLDAELDIPLTSALVRTACDVPLWVIAAEDAPAHRAAALNERGVEVLRAPRGADGRIHIPAMVKLLGLLGLTRLMVEGGPTTAARFLEAGVVDEVAVFRSPVILGSDAFPALAGRPLIRLTQPVGFAEVERAELGADHLVRLWRR
ncbi:bifunctional diaminohydroxyphosphoribosylaminopyrimidine deaminase/5-amino-6-(5-phosphoribosylamino)uracil reductase RibD [Xanthobacter flavus]|uniref:bifunctional diaminohydroxyphosphoribosylaminopyrimidine deaminase/5-amino-6-(5-phosphoribosylamino)uracil reductase RibD n=1 Tax=Xanthobacter flavus TaxID=281 RepID=UPI001AE26EA1|nr:bifunctional diaminohydroxyphosphoribosylaminopyrimidine deaminase/5-amino-6-(5-phosphoribosylamino)uracil reductase RibD [Xanthobacter flavus]MBP2152216.1 diaminohydroxyphosphoribosylaminopyrimidine deaminase/5-amino-6-(5-phosphoribosylamino)uracil reductase [Xanthobacter flavus]